MLNLDTSNTGKINIIRAVQTPLNFFVLVVLIVEIVLGVILKSLDGNDRTFVVHSMIILIFTLVLIVTLLALFKPTILSGKKIVYSLHIGPPENLNLDITQIDWNKDKCFLLCGDLRCKITLIRSRVGPTFRVIIPETILDKIRDEVIALELEDKKENHWEVKNFYLFENLMPLSPIEKIEKIIQDYGEDL